MNFSLNPGALNWGGTTSGNDYSIGMPQAAPAAFNYNAFTAAGQDNNQSGAIPSFGSNVAPVTPTSAGQYATAQTTTTGMDQEQKPGWLGTNIGTIRNVAEILAGFGQVIGGFQANRIAKDTLNFQKKTFDTNLANTIKSYNLALEDRIRSRYAQNERSTAEADSTIAANRM